MLNEENAMNELNNVLEEYLLSKMKAKLSIKIIDEINDEDIDRFYKNADKIPNFERDMIFKKKDNINDLLNQIRKSENIDDLVQLYKEFKLFRKLDIMDKIYCDKCNKIIHNAK